MAKKKKNGKRKTTGALPTIAPMVAGIDIGSTEHWVCGPQHDDGTPNVRVFRTTTPQLEELAQWLISEGVQSVAMESTHVYWIPAYEILEKVGIKVVLVNARHLRSVPGRKTDMKDCQWLQLLHSCGLLKGSFRPGEEICALRALQRQLGNLVAERSKCVLWMQKALDQMNVQVHRAVTDITGTTGMSIIRAIVEGERDPTKLATHRDPRCRKSVTEIAEHLCGNWRAEHLYNLASAMRLYDMFNVEIETYEAQLLKKIEALQPPERRDQEPPTHPNPAKEKNLKRRGQDKKRTELFRFAGVDLLHIDGISTKSASIILTEVGADLSAFANEKNFISWLRLCPRTSVSGGKPLKKRRNSLGASRIGATLRMAALSLQRSKTALGAFFRRKARYKGGAVAVFATARKLACLVYRMLRYGQPYTDIGEAAYEHAFALRRLNALRENANSLGYTLTTQKQALPAG